MFKFKFKFKKKIIKKNNNQISKYLYFGIKKKEARVDATPSDRAMQSYWLPSGGCLWVAAFWWLPSGAATSCEN